MKRIFLALSPALFAMGLAAGPLPKKPKLVLAVVVDQFRYDYLIRFRSDYTSGLKRLLDQGAVFDDAHYMQYPTVTAVGHSTFMSGATPSISGIVGNEWYERESKSTVTSVFDPATKLVGGVPGAPGSSPRRLLVSSLGDEIKMAGGGESKTIGISIKDRSAILPVGHMADAAYWFDADSNQWTTSTYYMDALPKWVADVNETRPHTRALGESWFALDAKPGDRPLCSMVAGLEGTRFCGSLEASRWGNELIEELAERAVTEEKLGRHAGVDLLAVSFSSNDYVGHAMGPDSAEARDISRRTDLLLGKLLDAIDREAGPGNTLVVLTADHGVAPVPEVNRARHMPGGRASDTAIGEAIQKALEAKYGPGKWVEATAGSMPYLSAAQLKKYKVNEADAEQVAAAAVRQVPHVYRVYTAEEARTGRLSRDPVGTAVSYAYFGTRSGNLYILLDPYYLVEAAGTSHGTAFNYDTHVPVIFMGAGVRGGHYFGRIVVNDIAPTLAAMLEVEQPSGSVGRVLSELWEGR